MDVSFSTALAVTKGRGHTDKPSEIGQTGHAKKLRFWCLESCIDLDKRWIGKASQNIALLPDHAARS